MSFEQFNQQLLALPFATSDLPFGPDVVVYRLKGKIFALLSWQDQPLRLNLKCDPEQALLLRELYPTQVLPGYHMNKKHWNTLVLDGSLPADEIDRQIRHSYDLIAKSLPKAERQALGLSG